MAKITLDKKKGISEVQKRFNKEYEEMAKKLETGIRGYISYKDVKYPVLVSRVISENVIYIANNPFGVIIPFSEFDLDSITDIDDKLRIQGLEKFAVLCSKDSKLAEVEISE